MRFLSLLVFGLVSVSAQANYPCFGDLCVGDRAVNVSRNNRIVSVIAIQPNATFSVRFEDTGAVGHGWQQIDLAPMKGCAFDLCVGQSVYNRYNNRYALIVAIQFGGRYVLQYSDTGALGNGWDRHDLVIQGQNPNPAPFCPPGTVWDPVLQRCVSLVTPPRNWVCSVPNQFGQIFTAVSPNRDFAARQALIQCSNASAGYVCRASDVRCRL